jgi:hypothetical protein
VDSEPAPNSRVSFLVRPPSPPLCYRPFFHLPSLSLFPITSFADARFFCQFSCVHKLSSPPTPSGER